MTDIDASPDKVELSLDSRQIFFVFFALSVVGCLVFVLGVMVGRTLDDEPTEGHAASVASSSLSVLDSRGEGQAELSFPKGLQDSAIDEVPATRTLAEPEPSKPVEAKPAEKPANSASTLPTPKAKPKGAATLARGSSSATSVHAANAARSFTLQMKAFSTREQADELANRLRANGHSVRVATQSVKGRVWHRVQVGSFATWEEGLSAKRAFESKENIIAYVVRES